MSMALHIGIGTGRELGALAKSVDGKYGITWSSEVRWVGGMLIEPRSN